MHDYSIIAAICAATLSLAGPQNVATYEGAQESRAATLPQDPVKRPSAASAAAADKGKMRQATQLDAPRVLEPWIEPGTPAIYHRPYLNEHTPVAIYRDGRQVYVGLPMTVKQPDGTFLTVPTRVELEPAVSVPIDAAETPSSAR